MCVCLFVHTGDVQIGLMDKKGQLEVEVIRARGLTPKPGSKSLPGNTYTHAHSQTLNIALRIEKSLLGLPIVFL